MNKRSIRILGFYQIQAMLVKLAPSRISKEIARHLQQLGVRRMQGFYFSEAVSAGAAELMLRLGVTRQLNPA